ncbi:hypothetical protein VNO77_34255 [Canavalia gladiata]|uniref:Uncharacterized protein n=1 Tax=Canavalia gladiata TaxID=3824 RepID=A0AAN9KG85_CANGL
MAIAMQCPTVTRIKALFVPGSVRDEPNERDEIVDEREYQKLRCGDEREENQRRIGTQRFRLVLFGI